MNKTELKIYLKSNPTSKSKLNNNVLNYIIPYSLLLQKNRIEYNELYLAFSAISITSI